MGEQSFRLNRLLAIAVFNRHLAEQLNLDLELIVELCHELEKEGKIGVLDQNETK